MGEQIELLPCPFCGKEASFERIGTHRQSCIVSCDWCGASLETGEEEWNSGRSWGRRACPTVTEAMEAAGREYARTHDPSTFAGIFEAMWSAQDQKPRPGSQGGA